jgi:hypothetical protein
MIKKKVSNTEWLIYNLRFTFFTKEKIEGDKSSWWVSVTGKQPEKSISQPSLYRFQAMGEQKEANLLLQYEPGRVDWFFTPPESKENETIKTSDEKMNLGNFFSKTKNYYDLIKKWSNYELKFERMAFGAILHLPVKDQVDGYNKLQDFLPALKIDSKNSSDLFYQINRPLKTEIGGKEIKLNRISKWSVPLIQKVLFIAGPTTIEHRGGSSIFCQLELDVNTSPESSKVVGNTNFHKIFDKLIKESEKIAREGDVL